MQKDVAKLIGVSEDCITNWENGRSEPQIQFMPKIIEFLGYVPIEVDTSTLGGRIRDYRIRHGLSYKKMGEVLGVDATTVGSREKELVKDIRSDNEKLEGLLQSPKTYFLILISKIKFSM